MLPTSALYVKVPILVTLTTTEWLLQTNKRCFRSALATHFKFVACLRCNFKIEFQVSFGITEKKFWKYLEDSEIQ